MEAFKYEGFIRGAFSLRSTNMIDRGEDPANLAEADVWSLNDLNREEGRYSICFRNL